MIVRLGATTLLFFINCFFDVNGNLFQSTKLEDISKNHSLKTLNKEGLDYWNYLKNTKDMPVKSKIQKRVPRKHLGEGCSTISECPPIALCVGGICTCPHEFYMYGSQIKPENIICRKKVKFGFFCSLSEDCLGYDSNSDCFDGMCKCINGTHYIGSRNLLTHHRKCYKILEREGDVCEIDEQCSRLADNHHKCRCLGRCDCTSTNRYVGCSICHENIKRTFFGGAAFIVVLLSSRVFSKMRYRTNSRQQQNATINACRDRCPRLNTSRTVPISSVSYSRGNLRTNRRVTASLPDVFLIESHSLIGIHSSHTADYFPQDSPMTLGSGSDRNGDSPPSYEDIVGNDRLVWNEPPPAYHEVAPKNT